MIHVTYRTDARGCFLGLQGHAGYDEGGRDIVCAGASAIVYALLGWLENSEDVGAVSADVAPGNTWVRCEGGQPAAAAFEMARIGLEQLALAYPDHVVIKQPD